MKGHYFLCHMSAYTTGPMFILHLKAFGSKQQIKSLSWVLHTTLSHC